MFEFLRNVFRLFFGDATEGDGTFRRPVEYKQPKPKRKRRVRKVVYFYDEED